MRKPTVIASSGNHRVLFFLLPFSVVVHLIPSFLSTSPLNCSAGHSPALLAPRSVLSASGSARAINIRAARSELGGCCASWSEINSRSREQQTSSIPIAARRRGLSLLCGHAEFFDRPPIPSSLSRTTTAQRSTTPPTISIADSILTRRWTSSQPSTMLGAWRCSGSSNAELVKNLVDSGLILTPRVAKVMQATDRGFYVSQDAYEDRPQPIGFKATISAPHMHAHALQVLSPVIPSEGGKVLDVGCGSGYLTAALARMVGTTGVCYGMDYIGSLVSLSEANVEKDDADLLSSGNVRLKTGDGWKGWAENGPFDAIHVGAAAETVPEDLVRQLKVGGRMVVPVGPAAASQVLVQVDRIKEEGPISESYTVEGLMSVVYVPLVAT